MSSSDSGLTQANAEWPAFTLRYTYNPEDVGESATFEPNELVVYDPSAECSGSWISAAYGSYVPISDIR